MPHNFDFTQIQDIKKIEIDSEGWVKPLFIEYGIVQDQNINSGILTCCWRVRGTKHTFTIPVIRLDYLSSGDYKKHFKDVLEAFREDYLTWYQEGFNTEWAVEYRDQYYKYIIT